MQLYALDQKNNPTSAQTAERKRDYFCQECRTVVRLREGEKRQPHFYHLKPPDSCRQNGKSATHLHVQHHILSLLPLGECRLERRFPEIGRIADAVWEKEKIVFEIQCSPMTQEEMLSRTEDYRYLGYQTVWILHERNYNRYQWTALERAIQPIPHYFSDMTPGGEGILYDQWRLFRDGVTVKTLPRLAIRIEKPLREKHASASLSSFICKRQESWPLHFEGDLLDLSHSDYLKEILRLEQEALPPQVSFWKRLSDRYHRWLDEKLKICCK